MIHKNNRAEHLPTRKTFWHLQFHLGDDQMRSFGDYIKSCPDPSAPSRICKLVLDRISSISFSLEEFRQDRCITTSHLDWLGSGAPVRRAVYRCLTVLDIYSA